jgi:isopenicillin-N epimerase
MIPMNVRGLGCNFYAGNCHKWMLAPTGSGFLYLGPGAEDRLQPLQVSWGYHFDPQQADERDEYGSTPRIRALEFEGTRDPCPWLTVPTAISFQVRLGLKRIRARMAELTAYCRQRLDGRAGLQLVTPAQPGLHGALTAFRLPLGTDIVALRRGLWERFRIEAPVIERPEGPLLRVSTHFYNTEAEIDRLAAAIPQLLG